MKAWKWMLSVVMLLSALIVPAGAMAQEDPFYVTVASVDGCQELEVIDNYPIGNWLLIGAFPQSGNYTWQAWTGDVEGVVPFGVRAPELATYQIILDVRADKQEQSRDFQVEIENTEGKRLPVYPEPFTTLKMVNGVWQVDQVSVVTTMRNAKNLVFRSSSSTDKISFDKVRIRICEKPQTNILSQSVSLESYSQEVTWFTPVPESHMSKRIFLPLAMNPASGFNGLPLCSDGQYPAQRFPISSTHNYFRCIGTDVQTSEVDMAAAVAVAVASGAFAITPVGWVVIGAVVIGSVAYTIYLVDSQSWENYQYKDSVEIFGDPWIVDEWFDPSMGVLGPQTGYVLQDETQMHLVGDQMIEGGITILKSKVDPVSLYDKLPLWLLESPSQSEAANAVALVLFKSDYGGVYVMGIFEADALSPDWETQQRIEPLQYLDDLIVPPLPPVSTEEGETVWYPPTPGTPDMKGSGHSAKPGTIFWTLKQSAWNLLWNYVLGDAAVGGNGGGDFDWCGIRKDGIRASTGESVYTVAMVKYDVLTYFRRIGSWAEWLGRNPELTSTVRGAILMINDKNPSAWWGVFKSAESGLPEYVRQPTPNGKIPKAADWSRYKEVPCNLIETFKCLTNPAGCIPPSLLPG